MLPRPRFRLPLWAAFAVVGAAYLVRSVLRGFDFRPDLPMDAVLLLLLAIVVALVAWVRADDARRDAEDEFERDDATPRHDDTDEDRRA